MSCSQGSSTDAIYRTNGDSLDWWQNKKTGWHTLRWLLVLLALLLVVGLVIYFLMLGECLYTNTDSENKGNVKSVRQDAPNISVKEMLFTKRLHFESKMHNLSCPPGHSWYYDHT